MVVLIALLGVGLLVYPLLSQYIFSKQASTGAQDYHDTINEQRSEGLEQALNEAVMYNENLEGNPAHDPFLADSGMVMGANYQNVLRLGKKEEMGYISIPKIDIRLPIFHGTSDMTLQKGVGHLEGSSLPVGGRGTHSVVTSHSGLSHARMFTDLDKLVEGDIFYYHILDQTLAYKVDSKAVVEPHDTSLLRRDRDGDYTTLVTCTPYGINTHRLMVRAVRTDFNPIVYKQLIEDGKNPFGWLAFREIWIGLATGLALVILALIILLWRKRNSTIGLDSLDSARGGGLPWQKTDGGKLVQPALAQAQEKYGWNADASG
jgi:sortase A